HQTRRCLAARPRRSARGTAGSRRGEGTEPPRGNRYHVRHRLEGPLSHRRTGVRLLRSRHRPGHHHPRLSDREAHSDRVIGKFQICLASFTVSFNATQVANQSFQGLNFIAGQPLTETFYWQVPANSAVGTYTVTVSLADARGKNYETAQTS